MKPSLKLGICWVLLVAIAGGLALAAAVETSEPVYATERGAIDGYDPVSYFKKGVAERGDEALSYAWKGVDWHFSSQAHLDTFKNAPEKYLPRYGGFCALGTAHGGLVPSDGDAFSIVDGKLYLNQSAAVRETWNYQPSKMIRRADSNWASRSAPPVAKPSPLQAALSADFALMGLDPVSYFNANGVVAGKPDITAEWSGLKWRFASAEHRDRFLAEPQRYLPQFGGNSTLTVAHGAAIPASPLSYLIYQDKLYFDFSPRVVETLSYAPDRIIERAQRNWKAIQAQP